MLIEVSAQALLARIGMCGQHVIDMLRTGVLRPVAVGVSERGVARHLHEDVGAPLRAQLVEDQAVDVARAAERKGRQAERDRYGNSSAPKPKRLVHANLLTLHLRTKSPWAKRLR